MRVVWMALVGARHTSRQCGGGCGSCGAMPRMCVREQPPRAPRGLKYPPATRSTATCARHAFLRAQICLTIHFKPLWAKNAPHFGIAHAMCLGLAPWLAAEVPYMVEAGLISAKV